eukprot:53687-Amphidinium_carterae.1
MAWDQTGRKRRANGTESKFILGWSSQHVPDQGLKFSQTLSSSPMCVGHRGRKNAGVDKPRSSLSVTSRRCSDIPPFDKPFVHATPLAQLSVNERKGVQKDIVSPTASFF